MKVLLFSNDLMPFGELPTSGGGLRCWQLMQGLQARGVEVIASMPGFTFLAEKHFEKIPPEQREALWRWETQDDLVKRYKPDAVLFASNWDHFNLNRPIDIPIIIDLHGSRLIETTMWGNPVSTEHKVNVLSKADCLLTAGRRQRSYFYGWLVQAGRVPENEHFIRYIPISLGPDAPQRIEPDPANTNTPLFVSGGGWFPWQNQSKAIFSVCNEVATRNRGSVQIFGTPHETSQMTPEEQVIRDIYARIKGLSTECDRIKVEGYIGRDALIEIYRGASVAVEAMQYNLERELAFTTRTIEYLWCGLPVLYNNYSEISGHIAEYDAGWTIDPTNDLEISQTLDEIFTNPALVKQKSENARRLVQERFRWDQTIEPLLDFLNHPTKAAVTTPSVGAIYVRPSYLSPRGATADVALGGKNLSLKQIVRVPAENISSIQVPIVLANEDCRSEIDSVQIIVREYKENKTTGRVLARRRIKATGLPSNGSVSVGFPRFRRPPGGAQIEVSIELFPINRSNIAANKLERDLLFVRALVRPTFPFSEGTLLLNGNPDEIVEAHGLLGDRFAVQALALHFIPGGGGVYRARIITTRAIEMIKKGEWLRLMRAVRYRIPRLIARVKAIAF